jgi:hypothetical protein
MKKIVENTRKMLILATFSSILFFRGRNLTKIRSIKGEDLNGKSDCFRRETL